MGYLFLKKKKSQIIIIINIIFKMNENIYDKELSYQLLLMT